MKQSEKVALLLYGVILASVCYFAYTYSINNEDVHVSFESIETKDAQDTKVIETTTKTSDSADSSVPVEPVPQTQPEMISDPNPPNVSPETKSTLAKDYSSIILQKGGTNSVNTGGSVTILFSRSATISFNIEKVYSPNTDFNKDKLSFVSYNHENNLPKDPSNNNVYGKYGDYSFTFKAPDIPGTYDVVFSEPELRSQGITDVEGTYRITVRGKVDNELLALRMADRALFAKLDDQNIQNWKIVSKKVKEKEREWYVDLKISYDSCGIDWEEDECVPKSTEGAFYLSKDTGFITEWIIDT